MLLFLSYVFTDNGGKDDTTMGRLPCVFVIFLQAEIGTELLSTLRSLWVVFGPDLHVRIADMDPKPSNSDHADEQLQ